MRQQNCVSAILGNGGLSIHGYVAHLLSVSFPAQCWLVSAAVAGLLLIGSAIDGSLVLKGRDIGLLEHPAIWAFLGLQIALPLTIRHSLFKLLRARVPLRNVLTHHGTTSDVVAAPLLRFLQLNDPYSRFAATLLYCIGLAAFVWNTYQNQLPGVVLPYDFWDSTNHVFGFWLTRVYKFYLFVWLLPYIALVHVGIMFVLLRTIRCARVAGEFALLPFHPDGVGGLGFVSGLATMPITVMLLVTSIPAAAAFAVHRALDVTPLMGVGIILVGAGIAYAVPMACLRSDIIALKQTLIGRLSLLQQSYYSRIMDSQTADFDTLRQGNEALDYFEKVCVRVRSISNYPHLKRLIGYVGFFLTPSAISLALKVYEEVIPVMIPSLGRH